MGVFGERMIVVGVEAHPLLAACAKSLIDTSYDSACRPSERERQGVSHLRALPNQYEVVQAAVGSAREPFVGLWRGVNQHGKKMGVGEASTRTDIGVYKGTSSRTGHHVRVPTVRMSALLSSLPQPAPGFKWGCLKTDAQGSDVDAIVSAGAYVRHFACIVMEHWGPSIMGDAYVDPIPYLLKQGFIRVTDPPNYQANGQGALREHKAAVWRHVFINTDRFDDFERPELYKFCDVSDVRHAHAEYQKTIAHFRANGFGES